MKALRVEVENGSLLFFASWRGTHTTYDIDLATGKLKLLMICLTMSRARCPSRLCPIGIDVLMPRKAIGVFGVFMSSKFRCIG